MKVCTVLGARPQFIKAANVSREIEKHKNIEEIIIHTGQHYDVNMSDIFFKEMDIPEPKYNLKVKGQSHGQMTGEMLGLLDPILMQEKPDIVLVYGDTNSTLAGALCAKKLLIPVMHVESGLRSYNLNMPEEINRILTDRISDILCCPTEQAVKNLSKEAVIPNANIVLTGDVMFDSILFYKQKAKKTSLKNLPDNFILTTIHRAENTNDLNRLGSIVQALNAIAKKHNIIMPVHPRTRKIIQEQGLDFQFSIIDPVGYFDMLYLLQNTDLVITDSGGLQKEAYFMKKPCVTLRDETEWLELVDTGVNKLCGSDYDLIIQGVEEMLEKPVSYDSFLYGKGDAGSIIVQLLDNVVKN